MKGLNSVCQVKSPLWFSNPIPHSSEPDTGEPDLVDPVILLDPLPGTQLHLLVLQQAFVEQLLDDFVVQVLSDEDQLLASISPFPCLLTTVKNLTNQLRNMFGKIPLRTPWSRSSRSRVHLGSLPRGVSTHTARACKDVANYPFIPHPTCKVLS